MSIREQQILSRVLMKVLDLGAKFHLFGIYTRFGYNSLLPYFKNGVDEKGAEAFLHMYRMQKDLQAKYPAESDFLEFVKETMARRKYEEYIAVSDCSSLIFAHSLLDGVLDDLLDITENLAKQYWEERIGDRQITIAEAASRSLGEIRHQKVQEIIEEHKHRSLPNKVRCLTEIIKPDESIPKVEDYSLSLKRLGELNDERNRITHEKIAKFEINEISEKVTYLNNTGKFLAGAIRTRFNLQVDGPAFLDYLREKVRK